MPDGGNTNAQANGNHWITLDTNAKYAYVEGFLEGMFLGHCFTTWGLPGGQDSGSTWQEATKSYDENWNKFALNISYTQYVEGLDQLYSNDANRQIKIKDGMWITMNKISPTGGFGGDLNTMIEAFRQNFSRV